MARTHMMKAWRLVCHSETNNSHKFYDIYYCYDTRRAIYRWGRVGAKGQFVVKDVATWEVSEQLRSKMDKGYVVQVDDLRWEVDPGPLGITDEAMVAEAEQKIARHLRQESNASFGDQRLHEFTQEANEIIALTKSKKVDVGVLLDRWDLIKDEWKVMATAYEHARLALLEAEQAVSRKVMGG